MLACSLRWQAGVGHGGGGSEEKELTQSSRRAQRTQRREESKEFKRGRQEDGRSAQHRLRKAGATKKARCARSEMDTFLIKGGKALRGTVAISGAKNSALPAMAAALLTAEKVTLHNIPKVRDLITMSKLLAFMDAKVSVAELPSSDYEIEAPTLNHAEAPYELVKTMRASVLTLGPLMARVGVARVSLPGGCAMGARPVDLHLSALEKMGAEITMSHGYIEAKVSGSVAKGRRLKGAHIV